MTAIVRKVLAFASVSLLLATQACSAVTPAAYPNPYPNPATVSVPTVAASTVAAPAPSTAESVVRVSLEDAKTAFDTKTAIFLDVRGTENYNLVHIPGALDISLDQFEARLGELDPNAWIIPYCT